MINVYVKKNSTQKKHTSLHFFPTKNLTHAIKQIW